jgi:DNA modification methylase
VSTEAAEPAATRAGAIPVFCAHTSLVAIEKLVPNPRNPNTHPEKQIELLAKIIKAQGWRNPVVVSKRSGFVIKGHGRLDAAKLLTADVVPVDFQDYESEAAEWADMIADNRIAELAEADEESLKALLKDLDGKIDLDLTGFDADSLDDILERLETKQDDATVPAPPVNPLTKPGDLYELGPHRLLCGDSTNVEDVRRLMNGQRAILFATDPPYLVGYDGTNHPGTRPKTNTDWSETYGATWDEADDARNCDLYDRFIKAAVEVAIDPNAAWYCWHASRRQRMVEDAWEKNGAFVHQQIIWSKPNRPILTRSWYLWAHEPCFFGWIKGNKPPRESPDYERSVWEIEGINNDERPDHPTPKPLECFAVPMRQHTKRNDLCYEPFSGSGTQLVAGDQLGRRVYGLEISPAYCDVIVRRWLALAPGRQVICNGEDVTKRFTEESK